MTDNRIKPLSVTAAGSGRRLTLGELGVPIVLLFVWQETSAVVDPVHRAIRDKYPLASQVLFASLADLRGIPRIFKGMVEREMSKGYREAAAELPEAARPEDYVIIIPDWDGRVCKAVGLRDTQKVPGLAVLDADGGLVGVYQGDDPVQATLDLLSKAGARTG